MKSFSIENIKSFKDKTEIEIKPITILVGKNSCGKSSLIRFPVVLAQTTTGVNRLPLQFYGNLIDYGTFDDVVYSHKGNEISYSVKYDFSMSYITYTPFRSLYEDKPAVLKTVEIKTRLGMFKDLLAITRQEIIFDNKCIYVYSADDKNETFRLFGAYDFDKQSFDDVDFEVTREKKSDFAYGIFEFVIGGKELKTLINNTYFSDNYVDFDDTRKQRLINKILFSKSNNNAVNEIRQRIKTSTNNLNLEDKINPEALLSTTLDAPGDSLVYLDLIKDDLLNKLYKDSGVTYRELKFWYIYAGFEIILDIVQNISSLIRRENAVFSYLGPFRQEPERIYRYSGANYKYLYDVGVKGENVNNIFVYNFHNKEKPIFDDVSNWLNKSLGYKLLAQNVANGYYQLLLEDKNGIKTNIADVGYGISQVLPIVTQTMMSKYKKYREEVDAVRTDVIVVEQPELHLHPAAQAELADLFVACVTENKNQRMLIETHSEHFIRKLQVLVADKNNKITSDDIAVYYVDKNDKGEAFIDKLNLLPNGQFEKEWPTGFFDKALELSMDLIKKNSEA